MSDLMIYALGVLSGAALVAAAAYLGWRAFERSVNDDFDHDQEGR